MTFSFLKLAMVSPERQATFRRAAIMHLLLVAGLGYTANRLPPESLPLLGHVLLVAGIVEGATLIGWRLAQLPKSQALEFLLVSPLQPKRFLLDEALVGISRLALVTLTGLPALVLMIWSGRIEPADAVALLVTPFVWGCLTGLALTVWAYERLGVRRWGERVMLVLILIYLIVGVLAAERLSQWLTAVPWQVGEFLYRSVFIFSQYNPFGALEYWLSSKRVPELAWQRLLTIDALGTIAAGMLLSRAAFRLKGHFHDRHYKPAADRETEETSRIGERPLSWWAVRRVMEYSGRSNLWLAGGFGMLYAAYILLGDSWPVWMGRMVFQIFERLGGVPALTTGLVVLAAVPAAFQYGLWDASTHERCKKLELLLLTELDGLDYWSAAMAAAWRRGRGYLLVAAILWLAMGLAGRATWLQASAAMSAGLILWAFSFAVGFRAFSRGVHANGLGSLLTLGLPILTAVLLWLKAPMLAALLPPGAVYLALAGSPSLAWLPGPLLIGATALVIGRSAQKQCDRELRTWFDRNQGRKILE
jgi:hypothetical protein